MEFEGRENCKTGRLSYLTLLPRVSPASSPSPKGGPEGACDRLFVTCQERRERPARPRSPDPAPCPSLQSAQLPAARCRTSLPGCAARPRSNAGNKGTRCRPAHPTQPAARPRDRRVPEAGPPAAAAGSTALPLSGTWRRRGAEQGAGGGGSSGSTTSSAKRRLQAVSTPFPSSPHPTPFSAALFSPPMESELMTNSGPRSPRDSHQE